MGKKKRKEGKHGDSEGGTGATLKEATGTWESLEAHCGEEVKTSLSNDIPPYVKRRKTSEFFFRWGKICEGRGRQLGTGNACSVIIEVESGRQRRGTNVRRSATWQPFS